MADSTGTLNLIGSGVNTIGSIWTSYLKNDAADIEGKYKLELQKLVNDKSLSDGQFQAKLIALQQQTDVEKAQAADAKRADTLKLIGVITLALAVLGGCAALIIRSLRR